MNRAERVRGEFGAVASYRCESCGPFWLPVYVPGIDERTGRRSLFVGCPHCDGPFEANEDPGPFKAIRRYSIHRNPKYRGAA